MTASRTSIRRFLPWKRHLHEQMHYSKMIPFELMFLHEFFVSIIGFEESTFP
jgi:hypothetical protein